MSDATQVIVSCHEISYFFCNIYNKLNKLETHGDLNQKHLETLCDLKCVVYLSYLNYGERSKIDHFCFPQSSWNTLNFISNLKLSQLFNSYTTFLIILTLLTTYKLSTKVIDYFYCNWIYTLCLQKDMLGKTATTRHSRSLTPPTGKERSHVYAWVIFR